MNKIPTTQDIKDAIDAIDELSPEHKHIFLIELDNWERQIKADAWDEGYEQLGYPVQNPYRKEQ